MAKGLDDGCTEFKECATVYEVYVQTERMNASKQRSALDIGPWRGEGIGRVTPQPQLVRRLQRPQVPAVSARPRRCSAAPPVCPLVSEQPLTDRKAERCERAAGVKDL